MFAVEKVLFSLPAWMDINYCVDDVFCAFCLSSSTSLGSPLGRETNCTKFVRVGHFPLANTFAAGQRAWIDLGRAKSH